jgi:ribosomal protein S12 methylthiotransferase accessory factor
MEMSVHFPGGKRVAATYRDFTILTDQPPGLGGEGVAPTPFELFLASLATGTGEYVLAFCHHRGLSTDGMEIVQYTVLDPHTQQVARVLLEIRLPLGFPERFRLPLVRAAQLCPVSRQMQNPPAIDVYTRLPGEASVGPG